METKIFGDKKLIISQICNSDLDDAKSFLDFINPLIREDAKILMNQLATIEDEENFLKDSLNKVKSKKKSLLDSARWR